MITDYSGVIRIQRKVAARYLHFYRAMSAVILGIVSGGALLGFYEGAGAGGLCWFYDLLLYAGSY